MSAAEIIEQIKALPEGEVKIVREFLNGNSTADGAKYVDVEHAKAIASGIFERNAELFRKLAQ